MGIVIKVVYRFYYSSLGKKQTERKRWKAAKCFLFASFLVAYCSVFTHSQCCSFRNTSLMLMN